MDVVGRLFVDLIPRATGSSYRKLFAQIKSDAKKNFDPMAQAIQSIKKEEQSRLVKLQMGKIKGGGGGGLGGVMGGIGKLGMVGAGMMGAGLVGAAGLAAVGQANPATVEKFQLALKDVAAVIGRSLMPVVEIATEGLRLIGDVLAAMLPSPSEVREVVSALSPTKEFRETLGAIGKLIGSVLVKGLHLVGKALRALVSVVYWVFDKLKKLPLVGKLLKDHSGPLKSTMGAAAGQAGFVGAEEHGRQLMLSAFGSGLSFQEETARNTREIKGILSEQHREMHRRLQEEAMRHGTKRGIDGTS